jgi:hypothetical protein
VQLVRGLIVVSIIAAALVAVTIASGQRSPVQDGTLSVRDGRASMLLRVRGSIIGQFARGKLTVTEPSGPATVVVRGAEETVDLNDRTTVYSGVNVRFRIADDRRVVVKLNGKGLSFSVVGRGDVWMDGWGDPEGGIFFDGSYSLNGAPYQSLPNNRTRFELATESGAG